MIGCTPDSDPVRQAQLELTSHPITKEQDHTLERMNAHGLVGASFGS